MQRVVHAGRGRQLVIVSLKTQGEWFQGGSIPPHLPNPFKKNRNMKIKFNHTEETTTDAFGIKNIDAFAENLSKSLADFALDKDKNMVSHLGELIQENLTDEEILFLATQRAMNYVERSRPLVDAFIDYLKERN